MALEPAFNNLDDLNPLWPTDNDPVEQGDDHLRGIKAALDANITGDDEVTRLIVNDVARLNVGAEFAVYVGRVFDVDYTAQLTGDTLAELRARNAFGGFSIGTRASTADGILRQIASNGDNEDPRMIFIRDGETEIRYVNQTLGGVEVEGLFGQGILTDDPTDPAGMADARFMLRNADGLRTARFWFSGTDNRLRVSNLMYGGVMSLHGTNLAGEGRMLCQGDPEGGFIIKFNGSDKLQTLINGAEVIGADAAAVDFVVRNTEGGGMVRADDGFMQLIQTDSAGVAQKVWLSMIADGAVNQFHDGRQVTGTDNVGLSVGPADGLDFGVLTVRAPDTGIQGGRLLLAAPPGEFDMAIDANDGSLRVLTNQLTELGFVVVSNGPCVLYNNGIEALRTQNPAAGHVTSGALVMDHELVQRDVGFNVMPVKQQNVSHTFTEVDVGSIVHKSGGGAVTYTLPSGITGPFAKIGASVMVANEDVEPVTLDPQGTLRWFKGDGGVPQTGNRTLARGGVCTCYHYSNTEWWVWGNGLS